MASVAPKRKRLTREENNALRCQSMIDAANLVISQYDLAGATVERICEEAGVSPGLISHHFGSRANLLQRVCQDAFAEHQTTLQEIIGDGSRSAKDRLIASVESNFRPPAYTPVKAAVWLTFFNASRSDEVFHQVVMHGAKGYRTLFVRAFSEAAQEIGVNSDAERAAIGLITLMDGLWSNLATGKDGLTPDEAITICNMFVRDRLRDS